jgi:hypothetical protein
MSNINTKILPKTQSHTEALIGYVLDAKPYHVKLAGITERYDIGDEVAVKVLDSMISKIFVGADTIDPNDSSISNTRQRQRSNSWWKHLASDASTRTWQIPTVGSHKFESELAQQTLIAGIDSVASIPGIENTSSFVFKKRRHDGPSICDVRKMGIQQQEGVDYFLSDGSLSFTVEADGTWLENFLPSGTPRNSGAPEYADLIKTSVSITNITGGNNDSWTLTCTNETTGELSVVGKYSGNIGSAVLGTPFTHALLQFDYPIGFLALGDKVTISPKNKFITTSVSTPQTWTIIKTNPLAVMSKAVFTGASGTPIRQPSVHIHTRSLARASSSATWRIEFTSPSVFNLVKTGTSPSTVVGIDLRDGCSFKNSEIHFTIQPPEEGFFAGDAFQFSTEPSVGEYLVFGSVSGWKQPAKNGEWYWNGEIGFKIPKLNYFVKPEASDWDALDILSQENWFIPVKDVHSSAVPSVYTITFQPPVLPSTTVTHATVDNNIYGYRAGLTIGQTWEDEFCSFIVSPSTVSAGEKFQVFLTEPSVSVVSAGYDELGFEQTLYDMGIVDAATPVNLLQAKYPLPDNHGSVIFKTGCFLGDEVIINISLLDLFRLRIDSSTSAFPELAAADDWIPLEFRYFDRPTSSATAYDGETAHFPDASIAIEAYLCSDPTIKVLTVNQPRYQCSSRNSAATVTFDPTFFSKYLKFGARFSLRVDQDTSSGQRASVSVTESLSIQII